MKLNKKQKRTATIASMAALLAVVLGMGGQTFAKYIETKDVADTATVAKFGFVINTNASNLGFSKYYKETALTENNATATVATTGDANVVAPGTSGSVEVTVTGSAEVDSRIEFTATGSDISLTYQKAGIGDTYYPIKWTLTEKEGDTVTTHVDAGTLAAVIAKLNAEDADYEANGKAVNSVYTISWKWAYEGQNDTYDTYLGWYKAETLATAGFTGSGNVWNLDGTDYTFVDEVSFNLNVTITQVD